MEGGVIRIRFEADTSGIDEQLKQLEKAAENVSKITSSSTKKASSEAKKEAKEKAKIERDANKESARMVKNKFALEEELRAEQAANLKRSVANSITLAKEAQKAELEAERQLQWEQETRFKAQKRQEREAARAQREQERVAKQAQRDQIYNLKKTVYLYYDLKAAVDIYASGWKDLTDAVRKSTDIMLTYYSTVAKVVTPVTTLTANFLKTSGVLNKIKSAFSFNSILQFGKSSVEAASDLTEVQNIVETAFPNMTDQMNDWAKASINAFGLSEKSAKQYASTLGLMAQSAGLAEDSSYKLGTSLTAVTADLASIYNMNASDVYEKIRSGVIGGRTAAIAQLGINMNQSNLQAYMESKGLSSKYTSLDNATKTIIRYNYVLEQTKKIQGDFVKTQGTWANQTRILAENMTALKAELGSFIVTVLTPALQVLNGILQVLTKAIAKIKEILHLLGFKIQSAASSSSISLDGYADGFDDVGDAADEAASKVAKLSDGPFSEMHKVADNAASSLGNVFGGSDGLLEYENPYKVQLESLGKVEGFLERISKKLDLGELKIAGFGVLKEIVGWIDAIKKVWKDAWNNDDRGTKYLQSFVDMVTSILNVVEDISNAFRTMYESEWGQIIFEKMLDLATKLNVTVKQIFDRFDKFWNKGSGIYDWVDTKAGKTSDQKAAQDLAEINGKKRDTTKGFISYSAGGDFRGSRQDMLDKVNQDKEYRELTWGEFIANQFYKAQAAILDCLDALLNFIQEVNKNIDWEEVFKGWGESLDDFTKFLNKLSDWLNNNEDIAKILGDIMTFILANPDDIAKTAAGVTLVGGAIKKIGKTFIAYKLGKAVWRTFFGSKAVETAGAEVAKKAGPGFFSKLVTGAKGAISKAGAVLSANLTAAFAAGLIGSEFAGNWVGRIFDADEHSLVNSYKRARENGEGIGMSLLIGMKESTQDYEGWGGVIGEASEALGRKIRSDFETIKEAHDMILVPGFEAAKKGFELTGNKIKEDLGSLKESFAEKGSELKEGWGEVWNKISSGAIDAASKIADSMSRIVDAVGRAIKELLEFIGVKEKTESKSNFTGTKGAAWVKTSGAQKAGYANIRNITKHAAGGVFTPNRPHLAVLGDHRSETEFALTESHLDEIANRMAGAISSQMMRMSAVQNSKSSGNNTYIIQIGDEQIQDFIVKTVDENNYRR